MPRYVDHRRGALGVKRAELSIHENGVRSRLTLSGFGIGRHRGVVETKSPRTSWSVDWMGDLETLLFDYTPTEVRIRVDGSEITLREN